MAKTSKTSLLDAGLRLLGEQGSRRFTLRAVEDEAEVTHGTIRHHFGDYEAFLAACVDHLLLADFPGTSETPEKSVARWLGPQRMLTRARYELALMSTRDKLLSQKFVAARDTISTMIEASSDLSREDAHAAMAALDGLIFDALLRDEPGVDPAPLLRRFGLA